MDLYRGTISKRDRRAFLPQPISDESLRRILRAGRMTPSSKNSEPNRFIVVRSPEGKRALANLSPMAQWLADAAVVIVIAQVREHPFDAGRCAQNMMLAAFNDGIGSCPAHLPEEALRELLAIPPDVFINRVIGFGYIDPENAGPPPAVARRRKPLEELVHSERWGQSAPFLAPPAEQRP
ncbi:nitroreductase family protein [Tepidiforma sp.]|uniref:nitroreductase family protein n=1 Tax=Tepidiforma sp. TaxID=2682230 RepID=UPI002ADD8BD0|nr:nitroreductase family protein [Tepidiforma sp.]